MARPKIDPTKPKGKYYVMPMFPYPSGTAMHVGHTSNYMINEFVARYRRAQGYDVIHPLGYDSFGLPTENFAIKNNKSAHQATDENVEYFEKQVAAMNMSFDKDRRLRTSDPEYYKWTQWIFAKLFEQGLVYKKDGLVNRCNGCQTVLANDQVVDGRCERCETVIIQKKHPQRYIKITDYAHKLLDYTGCERPSETIAHQKHWIGESEGCEIDFPIKVDGGDCKYIIFDFDGVLGDSLGYVNQVKIENKLFGCNNIEEAIKTNQRYASTKPNHSKDHTLSPQEEQELLSEMLIFNQCMTNMVKQHGSRLFDQFISHIYSIQQNHNCKFAIVSAGGKNYISEMLKDCDVKFDYIYGYEDHSSKEVKIENICKDRGVKHQDIYYITDTLADYYELQDFLSTNHIIGCAWGICGADVLAQEMSRDLIMTEFDQLEKLVWEDNSPKITVFTTKSETIYGVTALILAPENEILDQYMTQDMLDRLTEFRTTVGRKSALERGDMNKDKLGLCSGIYATHPLTGQDIPIWYGDFVLADYGTGAVMFVPSHDIRDQDFATKYDIPFQDVLVFGD